MFGNTWTNQFGKFDVGGEWAKTLSGLTMAHIEFGINRVRQSGRAWPPTAPEFREYCIYRPEIPSFETSYAEISRYLNTPLDRRDPETLSDAVRFTKNAINFYAFQSLDLIEQMKVWRAAWTATQQHVASGKPLYRKPAHELIEHGSTGIVTAPGNKAAESTIHRLKFLFLGNQRQ